MEVLSLGGSVYADLKGRREAMDIQERAGRSFRQRGNYKKSSLSLVRA